jgi:hypothetical protein
MEMKMMKRLITLILLIVFCLTLPVNASLDIIWVSDAQTPANDFAGGKNVDPAWQEQEDPWDQGWVDLLTAAGYDVDYTKDRHWRKLDEDKLAALDAADLVIIGRDTSSGAYDDDEEPTQWNSVNTPMILMNSYIARSSKWKWFDTTKNTGDGDAPLMDFLEGVFQDIDILDETVGTGNTSFIRAKDAGNGFAIANVDDEYPTGAEGGIDDLADSIWIATWDLGVEFYDGAGQTAGADRMWFTAGTREGTDDAGIYWGPGMYNLTPEGEDLFLTAVAVTIPEPATIALLGLGGLVLLRRRR